MLVRREGNTALVLILALHWALRKNNCKPYI